MSLFGLGSIPIIEIRVDGVESRKHAAIKEKNGPAKKLPIYLSEDDISGVVEIRMNKAKNFQHLGVRIDLVGYIEIINDKAQNTEFMSNSRELEPSGTLNEDKDYKFAYNKFEKLYETYSGNNVKLRYFLRATIKRNYGNPIIKEFEFAVFLPLADAPEASLLSSTMPTQQTQGTPIKMEVGIEECLQIEFEYNKSKYHMKDVVIGKVTFSTVKIKIKNMELTIIKSETIGQGQNSMTDKETLAKYEIMDGCPRDGEIIPIRVYLTGYELTPTYKSVNGKFSVKYFLNLVLVDEDDRRYFKQQEIII